MMYLEIVFHDYYFKRNIFLNRCTLSDKSNDECNIFTAYLIIVYVETLCRFSKMDWIGSLEQNVSYFNVGVQNYHL